MDENQLPQPSGTKGKKSLLALAGVVVIGLIVLLVGRKSVDLDSVIGTDDDLVNTDSQSAKSETASTPASPSTTQTVPTTAPTSAYKNGTYTASGVYMAPSGQEQVGVEITLVDGVVTAVSLQNEAVNPTSKQFQTMCGMKVGMLVVGKSIDEIALTKISGSSLTPKGFNDALAKIKAEAKA